MRLITVAVLFTISIAVAAVPAAARDNASLEPSSGELLLERGRALIALGELDEAIRTLTLAREARPQDPAVYIAIADAYRGQGIEPMVVSQLEKALEIDSKLIEPRLRLAAIHLENQRWGDAGKLYQGVIRLDPTNDTAARELGKLYMMAKQPGPATKVLSGYVSRHPEDTEVVERYFAALAETGQHAEAATAAEAVLAKRTGWLPALLTAGRARAKLGECDRAIVHYLQAEAIEPLTSGDAVAVGQCYLALERDEDAAPWFERAVKDEAESPVDWAEPAAAFMRLRSWDQAALCYERKLAQDSTSVSAWVNYALCKQQTKSYEASRQALLRAVALREDFVEAQYNLATTYVLMDSTRAARRTYSQVIRLTAGREGDYRTQLLQAHRYIAVGYLVDKNWAKALPGLEQVLRLDPTDIETRLYLAQALMSLDRKDEARQEFETVLNRQPDNKQAKKGLDLLAQFY